MLSLKNPLCIYHVADLDGHCAGAVVKHAIPDVELLGLDYDSDIPFDLMKDRDVIIVDFSFQPWDKMKKLSDDCNPDYKLIWIDHHKSSIAAYDSYLAKDGVAFYGLQSIDKAGCELTWDYFHKQGMLREGVPTVVNLLGRYDVWDFDSVKNTREFQLGMRAFETRPEKEESSDLWHTLLWEGFSGHTVPAQRKIQMIVAYGAGILMHETKQNKTHVENIAFEITWKGLNLIVANKMDSNSAFFDSIWDADKYDAMCLFGWNGDQWKVSLYTTKDDVDVSEVAKENGGGGHAKAAGFYSRGRCPFKLSDGKRIHE